VRASTPLTAPLVLLFACARPAGTASTGGSSLDADAAATTAASPSGASIANSADASSAPDSDPPAIAADEEPDGDDDPSDPGDAPLPADLRFERVGRPPLALQRICDLTPLGDALYASHANQPLGTDGATITRYRPDDAKHPFSVAFDWNRPGEPTKGGGAGQGFLRVHAIGGRLFVPDTDPPYAGFGLSDHGTEGFVFVSDDEGRFAPAAQPGHRPPSTAGIVPRAYHVIDVVRFRGRDYASTGSVPPGERAWRGASPGALHVANEGDRRWIYEVDYPFPWKDGVWRLTYLVRFRGSLYAGIQDYDGREPNDYVVFSPPKDADHLRHEDMHAVRVTDGGAALTLRWFAHSHRLWWIALERGGRGATLRVTGDGETWSVVPLPADAGSPTDVASYRGAVVALTEWGLWRVDVDPPVRLAAVSAKRSPFPVDDAFCAAPLAVFRGDLYAGDQRDGALWRIRSGL
jgi:hypothetical protein